MLLVYYRLYITYTLSGFLFDLDQSNVCRDSTILESLVKECIPLPKKIYKRTKRLRTIDEVEEYFPGFKAFIDSTEQEIPRPKNNRKKRKSYYSGRKKKHTVKTQLMVNTEGLILHKTGHRSGRKHDYDIYKHNHPVTPSYNFSAYQNQSVTNGFRYLFLIIIYRVCSLRQLNYILLYQ